jgi:hypothetical protein
MYTRLLQLIARVVVDIYTPQVPTGFGGPAGGDAPTESPAGDLCLSELAMAATCY